jgi:hypothetical protein
LRLGGAVDISEREAHREAVHLRFGQRIRAAEFDRVLRRDDEEQVVHEVRAPFDGHLALGHHFQQRRLRARRSPVDFVGEQDRREHRPLAELEYLLLLVENRDAEDVRWEQVGRELHACEARADRRCEAFRERGLAGAGIVVDQHVPAGSERREQLAHRVVLAAHYLLDVRCDPLEQRAPRLPVHQRIVRSCRKPWPTGARRVLRLRASRAWRRAPRPRGRRR